MNCSRTGPIACWICRRQLAQRQACITALAASAGSVVSRSAARLNTSWAASVNRCLTLSEHSQLPLVERQWLCPKVAGSLACEQIGKRPRWGFTTVRRFEGGLCAMMGGAPGRRERRGDTLIAAAVLLVLVVGWVQGLSITKPEVLWALRFFSVTNAHASGPVR